MGSLPSRMSWVAKVWRRTCGLKGSVGSSIEADGVAEAGDDVAGGAVAQAAAAVVEEHRGVGAGRLPIGAGFQPVGQGLAQVRVDGQEADLAAVATFAADA